MMKLRQSVLSALLCALVFSGVCLAQGTGVIYGTVTDPSGAGVAAVRVEAVSTERGTTRIGSTGATGDYVFSAMPMLITGFRGSASRAGTQSIRIENSQKVQQ